MTDRQPGAAFPTCLDRGGRSSATGYSYIELLVAIGLLIVIMVPLVFLTEGNVHSLGRNRQKMQLHLAVMEVAEQLLSLPYKDLPAATWNEDQMKSGEPLAAGNPWPWRVTPTPGLHREVVVSEDAEKGWKVLTIKADLREGPVVVYRLPDFTAVAVRDTP